MTGSTVTIAPYGEWERSLHLSNGLVEAVLPLAVGPRLIRFGFCGGENQFAEFPEDLGRSGDREWRAYGGHRLWCAPEHPPLTYLPDNVPVEWRPAGTGVTVVQPLATCGGVQKALTLAMPPEAASLRVEHRLTNASDRPLRIAAWALSVMAPGGEAVLPLPPFVPFPQALLPDRRVVLWPYSRLNDPRITWGDDAVRIRQDARSASPLKLGLAAAAGWVAYRRGATQFVKRFQPVADAEHPDFGASSATTATASAAPANSSSTSAPCSAGKALQMTATVQNTVVVAAQWGCSERPGPARVALRRIGRSGRRRPGGAVESEAPVTDGSTRSVQGVRLRAIITLMAWRCGIPPELQSNSNSVKEMISQSQ